MPVGTGLVLAAVEPESDTEAALGSGTVGELEPELEPESVEESVAAEPTVAMLGPHPLIISRPTTQIDTELRTTSQCYGIGVRAATGLELVFVACPVSQANVVHALSLAALCRARITGAEGAGTAEPLVRLVLYKRFGRNAGRSRR